MSTILTKGQTYNKGIRRIEAPAPSHPDLPPSIYQIEVEEGFDVEWKWTQLPDGHQVVTGYQLWWQGAQDQVKH